VVTRVRAVTRISQRLDRRGDVGNAGEVDNTPRPDERANDHAWRAAAERVDAANEVIQAFVAEDGRRARLASQAASAPPGPLHGVPVGIKDIVRVDGLPTRAGSALPPEVLAGEQATVVNRLAAAGALVLGKTVTAEFAAFAPGPTRNPRNIEHTPGGSSSGSAAAVAAGMVPVAIGTQTIGSVIRPAAYCGVVGFAPTYGRIPKDGVIANAPSLDRVGLFTTDIDSAALVASVLVDDWQRVDGGQPVIGMPTGRYLERADEEADAAFRVQVSALRSAGFTVRAIPFLSDVDDVARGLFTINRYELARTHTEWFARFADLYRPQTADMIRQGQAISEDYYADALEARQRLRADVHTAMDGIDVWIAPAANGPAPRGLDSTGDPIMALPWSFAGLPAVSLPVGKAANGLPLGLQVVGRPHADEAVLAWSAHIHSALIGE
jgi:Asp-tRNA(Asn)/Glu-tRNA(Gln) amidotransferase A subunit family amidase